MQDPLELPVITLTSGDFTSMEGSASAAFAIQAMHSKGYETVIIAQQGKAVGFVTLGDVVEKVLRRGIDPAGIHLDEIMTTPAVELASTQTTGKAIESMLQNRVDRLLVVENGQVKGIVTQQALGKIIRGSMINNTYRKYGRVSERIKPIIGNIGLMTQFAGILLVVPAILGALLGETSSSAAIFLAVIGLFALGFMLNTYGEKTALTIKQSSLVVVSGFLILGLFGSIPYIYLNPFQPAAVVGGIGAAGVGSSNNSSSNSINISSNISSSSSTIDPGTLFVNSFYESISGFTTTGLTLIVQPENLPETFNFYRSYTQWVGGLSFIYVVMIMFYPQEKLYAIRDFLGISKIPYKQLFSVVSLIFIVYVAVLALFIYLLGEQDVFYGISVILSSVTGGGFSPTSTFISTDKAAYLLPIGIGMILSALPFAFHYSLFDRGAWSAASREAKARRAAARPFMSSSNSTTLKAERTPFLKAGPHTAAAGGTVEAPPGTLPLKKVLRVILSKEVGIYMVFMGACILLFWPLGGQDLLSSAFHVVSASTNSGFQLSGIGSVPTAGKVLLMIIMMVGGTAFSTAGGIKITRFLFLGRKVAGLDASGLIASVSAFNIENYKSAIISSANKGRENGIDAVVVDIKDRIARKYGPASRKLLRKFLSEKTVVESLIVIVSFIVVSLVSASILAAANPAATYEDAVFESISAVTTTGMSAGVVTLDSDAGSKLALAANMVAGRFEIIAILYIFIRPLRA